MIYGKFFCSHLSGNQNINKLFNLKEYFEIKIANEYKNLDNAGFRYNFHFFIETDSILL